MKSKKGALAGNVLQGIILGRKWRTDECRHFCIHGRCNVIHDQGELETLLASSNHPTKGARTRKINRLNHAQATAHLYVIVKSNHHTPIGLERGPKLEPSMRARRQTWSCGRGLKGVSRPLAVLKSARKNTKPYEMMDVRSFTHLDENEIGP